MDIMIIGLALRLQGLLWIAIGLFKTSCPIAVLFADAMGIVSGAVWNWKAAATALHLRSSPVMKKKERGI
jgi:hypothetical protein